MKDKDLNFEKALADLEAVVETLERGGLSLNDSLAQFEKGVSLARYLRAELDKAEKKVEILLKDEKGELKPRPFGLDEEGAESASDGVAAADGGKDEDADAPDAKPKGKTAKGGKKKDDESLPF